MCILDFKKIRDRLNKMAWPGVLKVAFVLTLLALFFITVGYLLPWWFVGTNYYLGVFYGLVCNPGDISSGNCTVFSYYDLQRENSDAAAISKYQVHRYMHVYILKVGRNASMPYNMYIFSPMLAFRV